MSRTESNIQKVRANAELYKVVFDGTGRDRNISIAKNYRDLTVEDFQAIPMNPTGNSIIASLLYTYSFGQLQVIDDIKPTNMNRQEFFHVLLREGARRDILGAILNNSGYVPREVAGQTVQITRPQGVPPVAATTARLSAGDAAFRDLFTSMIENPTSESVQMPTDLAGQLGYRGTAFIDSAAMATIIGYYAGSNRYYFDGKQPGFPAGSLPLTLKYDDTVTADKQQSAFCSGLAAEMTRTKPMGMDNAMAGNIGFLMARAQDAREAFQGTDVRVGLRGEVCPVTPLPWNPTTMGNALQGRDKARVVAAGR